MRKIRVWDNLSAEGRVTIKNSQYQEYLEQHMTRVFMDFLHSVAQQVDKENDYILVSEKED